jgi:hypothetical protein
MEFQNGIHSDVIGYYQVVGAMQLVTLYVQKAEFFKQEQPNQTKKTPLPTTSPSRFIIRFHSKEKSFPTPPITPVLVRTDEQFAKIPVC